MSQSTNTPTPKAITPEELDEITKQAEDERWLSVWKPSQFTAFEPPKDFVLLGDCHLTRGGLSVLGGSPGVGKSRAVLGLAIAGATGQSWMGFPVHSRFRTLIIQCENGSFRLKRELTEALAGSDLDEWLRITPPPSRGLAFSELEFQERVRAIVTEFMPGLIVIDPWNRTADGEKQGDYRNALDAVMACLPSREEERPAVLIVHHLRKRSGDANRKRGRDLLQELAGSYQIGSAARSVFVLEHASNDTTDSTVVLTCCKNNDGEEGEPTAWVRRNGLFDPAHGFDMAAFLSDEGSANGRQASEAAIAAAT